MYRQQARRDEARNAAGNLQSYLRPWGSRRHSTAESGEAARVAQLTQKTNQFNLTTRRYSEPRVAG